MVRIPRKLKNDPIVEALFEVRFTSGDIPEVAIGKLASGSAWANSTSQRLPVANVPAAIRESDPALMHQPVLQLQFQLGDSARVIKIGSQVFSYHALAPYPGWTKFEPELLDTAEHVFGALKDARATRFGFRYINVLTKEHLIEAISNLNIEVTLERKSLTAPLNVNYQRSLAPKHNSLVRVTSMEFVENPSPGITALVDVDIFTPPGFSAATAAEARAWLDEAHIFLKDEFFALIPEDIIDKLEEK
jgi:uncharacterized protein (TIGR04255 family)